MRVPLLVFASLGVLLTLASSHTEAAPAVPAASAAYLNTYHMKPSAPSPPGEPFKPHDKYLKQHNGKTLYFGHAFADHTGRDVTSSHELHGMTRDKAAFFHARAEQNRQGAPPRRWWSPDPGRKDERIAQRFDAAHTRYGKAIDLTDKPRWHSPLTASWNDWRADSNNKAATKAAQQRLDYHHWCKQNPGPVPFQNL